MTRKGKLEHMQGALNRIEYANSQTLISTNDPPSDSMQRVEVVKSTPVKLRV